MKYLHTTLLLLANVMCLLLTYLVNDSWVHSPAQRNNLSVILEYATWIGAALFFVVLCCRFSHLQDKSNLLFTITLLNGIMLTGSVFAIIPFYL